MARYAPSGATISFGPGPLTPAVRAIILTNVGVFLVTLVASGLVVPWLGLTPRAFLSQLALWQVVTYLFVHSPTSLTHILFNMLAVWMFGVDLERRWGTQGFTKYYFVTGIGAGLCVVLASLLPFPAARAAYYIPTIGASGAVYGLILAWVLLFPHRQILFMLIFPMPAWVFGVITGAMVFVSAFGSSGSGVSHSAHIGGLLVGWLYLKGPRNLRLELRYRFTKWRMERMRRRFNVHEGGRRDWENRLH